MDLQSVANFTKIHCMHMFDNIETIPIIYTEAPRDVHLELIVMIVRDSGVNQSL